VSKTPTPHYRIIWAQYGVKRVRYHGKLCPPTFVGDVEYRSRYAASTRAEQVYDLSGGKVQAIALLKVTPKPRSKTWHGSTAPSKAGADKHHA
jgi:hypothetical protein